MRTLYQASNALEAHMLQDLLAQQGISAHIQGEHLQGAVGELPAAGLVRLVVSEADHEVARTVIERWETAQQPDTATQSPHTRSRGLMWFAMGLFTGLAASLALVWSPVSADGTDHDRDGVLDEKWTYSPRGLALKMEADRNLDHKVDYLAHYDERGLIESAESDDDFDGVFETQMRFRAGNLQTSASDTDGDGFRDLRSRYAHGVWTATEYLNPSTGLVWKIEHVRLGKLVAAEIDSDRDGTLDTRVTYTPMGEIASRAAMPK